MANTSGYDYGTTEDSDDSDTDGSGSTSTTADDYQLTEEQLGLIDTSTDSDTTSTSDTTDTSSTDAEFTDEQERQLDDATTTRRERDTSPTSSGQSTGERTDSTSSGSGGGDGLTDAQQQDINAAVAADSSDLQQRVQGAETEHTVAQNFEQEVLRENPDLRDEDVRVDIENGQLVARYTDTGLERVGANPSNRDLRERAARGSRFAPGDFTVERGEEAATVRLTDEAAADFGREYRNYVESVGELVRGDPGYEQAIINQAPEGVRRAVENTPQPGPVTIADLSPGQQREVNEDLIGQYSEQVGAFALKRRRARTEDFGDVTLFRVDGTSPEEFTRNVANTIRGGSRDIAESLVPTDERVVFPTTSGVFVFEGDSQAAEAQRGAVQSVGDLVAAPFDAAVGVKEIGEYGAAGVDATLAGEGGEYLADTERAAVDLGERVYGQFRENPVGLSTRLAGTAALTGGAIRGAQYLGGPRAARATSVAIQPGEELAISAAQRGLISTRAATLVPGVRKGHIATGGSSTGGLDLGPGDVTGRVRAGISGVRDRSPIGVDVDPDAPLLEMNLRPEGSVDVGSVMSAAATRAGGTVRRGAGGAARRISDTAEGVADRAPTRTADQNLQQAFLGDEPVPGPTVRDVQRALEATPERIIERTSRLSRGRAGESDVALQQAFLDDAAFPGLPDDGLLAPLRNTPGTVRRGVRAVADRTPRETDVIRRLQAFDVGAGRSDVALQQAFTRGASFPSGPGVPDLSFPDTSGVFDAFQQLQRTELGAAGRGDVALQQAFTRGAALPVPTPSLNEYTGAVGAAAIQGGRRLQRELVAARFGLAERAVNYRDTLGLLPDLTIRVGRRTDADVDLDEPAIRSQIENPLEIEGDTRVDTGDDAADGAPPASERETGEESDVTTAVDAGGGQAALVRSRTQAAAETRTETRAESTAGQPLETRPIGLPALGQLASLNVGVGRRPLDVEQAIAPTFDTPTTVEAAELADIAAETSIPRPGEIGGELGVGLESRLETAVGTDTRLQSRVDTATELDTELRTELRTEFRTDIRTDFGFEFGTEFGTELPPQRDPDGRATEPVYRDVGFPAATGGSERPFTFGYFAEYSQDLVTGGLEPAGVPEQERLELLEGQSPGSNLPTEEQLADEVDVAPVLEFFGVEGDENAPLIGF